VVWSPECYPAVGPENSNNGDEMGIGWSLSKSRSTALQLLRLEKDF